MEAESVAVARLLVSSNRRRTHVIWCASIMSLLQLPLLSARAQTISPDPGAAFLPAWNELADRSGWQMLVSPPFPGAWPPPAGSTLVRYAFAVRLNPVIADGAEIAAPWATSTLGSTGEIVVERLVTRLQLLGVQGVRPLSTAEIALADREQDVTQRLIAGGDQATDAVVRDFMCGWIARQGVVAAAIMPLHSDFKHWLNCP